MARIIFGGHEGREPTFEEILDIADECSLNGIFIEEIDVYDTAIYIKAKDNEVIKVLRGCKNGDSSFDNRQIRDG